MSIDLNNIQIETPDTESNGTQEEGHAFAFLNKEINLFKPKFTNEKKEEFYSEVGMLLSSGLDIRTIFQLMAQEKEKDKHKVFYESIYDDLVSGYNLSEALDRTGYISPHEYYSVKIGEETGQLQEVLADLNEYFSRRIKQKRQLVSTFSYPTLVVITAIVVVTFMMNFIVPMFEDVFRRFNGELPGLTKWILSMSKYFQEYIGIVLAIILMIVVGMWMVRKTDTFRNYTSALLLKIPLLGPLLSKIYLARFCQTMALMAGARIPLITALELMEKIIGFYPFEKAMLQMKDDLMNGMTLHESMKAFSFFDLKLLSLTKVGEEVNKLAVIYNKLSKQYAEEVQHKIGILNSLMEPLLIIVVGVMVAVILIAMYMPMFQMSNSFF
ncbi:type II secretion system F family protein [Puteibacter caeruleilacunae]|nr:type II secretion system F family protein [Puteibacter caeruleilacunae]